MTTHKQKILNILIRARGSDDPLLGYTTLHEKTNIPRPELRRICNELTKEGKLEKSELLDHVVFGYQPTAQRVKA